MAAVTTSPVALIIEDAWGGFTKATKTLFIAKNKGTANEKIIHMTELFVWTPPAWITRKQIPTRPIASPDTENNLNLSKPASIASR